jgi:hypothetical protein
MATVTTSTSGATSRNLIVDYYDRLPRVVATIVDDPAPVLEADRFSPGFELPDLDDDVRRFFEVATAEWRPLADYATHRLFLLDLTRNPGTNTTKTLASLLIVARAVQHLRRAGEPVLIFSPTSANKGIALRDAVERALAIGLARPDQLRIAVLAPAACRDKLRSGELARDPDLRRLNPVLVYCGENPEGVKALARRFVREHAAGALRGGTRIWYSLELQNYLVADSARAFFEHEVAPTGAGARRRIHAHAVSSAYGLLGYNEGRRALEADGLANPDDRPGFLLVQHLGAPDMVLSLLHGSFDRAAAPAYTRDPATGLYEQCADVRFPRATFAVDEVLDPTFYTHEPPTSAAMNALIGRFGGDGIVVSLHECLARYPRLRRWFEGADRPLPADFRTIREWSLVMALTGVLNAADRGLLPADRDVVVHGSGFYTTGDYRPLERSATTDVNTVEEIASALRAGS